MRPETEVDALEVGSVVDKRYRLLEKLGEGGMGTVYRVEHVRMGKVMALKVMAPDLVRDRKTAERFRREAELVAKLDHPNIITVFDSGETSVGLLYLVMEYIQGKDLSAILREEGHLAPRRAMELVVPVLRALEHAHNAGIIHRDIKPANVMLAQGMGSTTVVKLLDFGVATVFEGTRDPALKITGAFDVVGTPSCMSPEQARGVALDRRSDVYSVSAMLFELIAGRGVFVGYPMEVIAKHLGTPPPTLRSVVPAGTEIPDDLELILAKGLAKLPEERFQSADQMRKAIELALGRPSSKILPAEKPLDIARREDWESFERGFRRQRVWVRLLATAVLIGSFAAATYVQRHYEPPAMVRGPNTEEREPNDLPSTATLIALGVAVKGHIGFRKVPSVSDLDVFEVDVPSDGFVSITVNGVPNVNLVIEVLRGGNGTFTTPWVGVDDAPLSTGEEISDLWVTRGQYFVRLSDRHRLDEPLGVPRENNTDAYTLLVSMDAPRKFGEREPNNRREDAMAVSLEIPVLGRGGSPGLKTMIREGDAPLPTWSVDDYRLDVPKERDRVCAVLGAIPFASLRLTALPVKDDPRALRHAPSVLVRDGVQSLCVHNDGPQIFEVRVADGSTGTETYPLAFFAPGPDGLAGVTALGEELQKNGRSEPAAALLAEARRVLGN